MSSPACPDQLVLPLHILIWFSQKYISLLSLALPHWLLIPGFYLLSVASLLLLLYIVSPSVPSLSMLAGILYHYHSVPSLPLHPSRRHSTLNHGRLFHLSLRHLLERFPPPPMHTLFCLAPSYRGDLRNLKVPTTMSCYYYTHM